MTRSIINLLAASALVAGAGGVLHAQDSAAVKTDTRAFAGTWKES